MSKTTKELKKFIKESKKSGDTEKQKWAERQLLIESLTNEELLEELGLRLMTPMTPTLTLKDAERFLKAMENPKKISKEEFKADITKMKKYMNLKFEADK